ncbi:cytochrome P450 [Deinococcus budaensis]|uniref:Cytochrome P450 n=1 Tax=Deinococcus budaensis TaxID=1665626 RepID=A0A7W8GHI6_9DEIO|nr:cytochrome P450 [Deinococcus budaensis]MBB5235750.1 cytochrome P450 [Deinococcus budaensis]
MTTLPSPDPRPDQPARCPFTGQTASLTRRDGAAPSHRGAVEVDARGVYRVHEFQAAREVLRSEAVRQAGFMSEMAREVGGLGRPPVLFEEGETHHEMRRSTARYFTPTHVEGYQPMIAALADRLIADLARRGEANLDDLSLRLAVNVAAQVVGLTSSALPGLERRVMAFVEGGGDSEPGAPQPPRGRLESLRQQANLGLFYLLDVKPAIQARRRAAGDDLISHLLSRGYSDVEIMTECLTYGTAGMVTTREFISAAAWHLLTNPTLRADYVHGTEKERHAILHEILRLEPVVTTLYRRAEAELTVGGRTVPAGSLLALNVQQANVDPAVVGEGAGELCPARPLPRGVQPPVLAFGDGHHRCPGAFLAIRESDVFLRRLLLWRDLEVVSEPRVSYNEVVKGYELRGFRVRLGGGAAR